MPGPVALSSGWPTRSGPPVRVHGLDLSPGMLRLARPRLSSCPGYVGLQRGDGRSLPYLAASFDATFMSFVLESFHPPDIERVLTEIKRVLRPRGRLAIVCLTVAPEPGLVAHAYEWMHQRFPHLIDCRPIDVLRHLERSGYRPTRVERLTLWRLPVMAVTAQPVGSAEWEGPMREGSLP